ncbi:universal stress protein [Glutamicibacter halophytocola]|uniref:universal stress protein n=1 Tax=Glutamicibacter halophytocola TaxID=1933880 RepID=UPI00321A4B2F
MHDPADFVLQAEQDHQVSLIVLGPRKRSRVGKLLMGSIAQRILIEADCPVLAVKAQN